MGDYYGAYITNPITQLGFKWLILYPQDINLQLVYINNAHLRNKVINYETAHYRRRKDKNTRFGF